MILLKGVKNYSFNCLYEKEETGITIHVYVWIEYVNYLFIHIQGLTDKSRQFSFGCKKFNISKNIKDKVMKFCQLIENTNGIKFLLNFATFSKYEVFQKSANNGNPMGDLCHFWWPHCLLDGLVQGRHAVVWAFTFLSFNLHIKTVVQGVKLR